MYGSAGRVAAQRPVELLRVGGRQGEKPRLVMAILLAVRGASAGLLAHGEHFERGNRHASLLASQAVRSDTDITGALSSGTSTSTRT
jgi:hypothetical protein